MYHKVKIRKTAILSLSVVLAVRLSFSNYQKKERSQLMTDCQQMTECGARRHAERALYSLLGSAEIYDDLFEVSLPGVSFAT